ncbi:MAG TPA: ACP S-malonyltransferase [Gemmatimonadales bacterium]|nr:ACP S-malonyltransferase [Gemmatimonadales bacterium]
MVNAVLLCPGQGAQRVGMGKDLADRFGAARDVFRAVDEALDLELSRLMWEGPEEELTLTHHAQPAILTHTLAVYAVMRDRLTPVAAAGHSLGEYSAYAVAGSLGLAEAARLVRRRGQLMLEAGERRPGAMAAVLGLATEAVVRCCQEASTSERTVVAANINAPDQTVVSGDPQAVDAAGVLCKAAGARRVLPLKVSGAFHSPLMQPAADGLFSVLRDVPFRDPAFPVIANVNGQPVRNTAAAVDLLGRQLTQPVRWVDCMRGAAGLAPDATFVEVGPGNVLTGLVKRIVPQARAMAIGSAEEMNRFLEAA